MQQAVELGEGAGGAQCDTEELGAVGPVGGLGVVVGFEGFFVAQGCPGGGEDGVVGLESAQAHGRQVLLGALGEQGGFDGAEVAGDGAAVEAEGAGDGGDGLAFAVFGIDAVAQGEQGVGEA